MKDIDEDKIAKMDKIYQKVEDDEVIMEAYIEDSELFILNENGESDENGNYFFIQLKNGYKSKVYKIDDSIDGIHAEELNKKKYYHNLIPFEQIKINPETKKLKNTDIKIIAENLKNAA